tara:strand:- start:1031 stop:2185 length:1155 start_codon:yes stop_codon:yes gene_type:complete
MALNVVSSDRLSTNVKTSNFAPVLSDKLGVSKNLIINGSMVVAQRGTSSTTSGYGSVDRWKVNFGGTDEAVTHAQVALTSSDTGPWAEGFKKALQLTNGNQTSGAGAADYIEVDQEIEAQNVVNSAWETTSTSSYVTLSFWVKSSIAQNFYGYLRSNDNTRQLYCFQTGSLSANTWTKVTKTIPGAAAINIDNDNGAGILLRLLPFYGTDMTGTRPLNAWAAYDSAARTPDSTATWYTTNDSTFAITGVQLEIGSTATGFEHRAYGDELQKCLRYFWTITGDNYDKPGISTFANSASTCRAQVKFPVPMRAAPSFTGSATAMMMDAADDSANFNINTFALNNVTTEASPSGCTLEVSTSSMTAGQAGDLEFKANSGFMQFSAEL